MAELRTVPIGDERFAGDDTISVRSPYDGTELALVPACSPADVERAVGAATATLDAGPLPLWRRAEILDGAARLLSERVDDFARLIATEAAKPLKTSRVEARRACSMHAAMPNPR